MAAYHKGYTPEQRKERDRVRKREQRGTDSLDDILSREVIVWDGEGMKLSGPDAPQHYVLFGCSAMPDAPLVIVKDGQRLMFEEIADYCLDVVERHPHAIHLGYFFKYDQNMIIWSLPWPAKQVLYSNGSCMVRRGASKYYIRIIFGKSIRITRIRDESKVTILIEDFAPFFATKFTTAYEMLFPEPTDPENWAVVVQGKEDRAVMLWPDMARVTRYWRAEIIALQELAFEFRRLMFAGGFMLRQWHGPGALANYIRKSHDLVPHEWGGKEENLPEGVHEASKGAFIGGHFEQYKVGYVEGPIYSYDKNSAYPRALCDIPSLREGGHWTHIGVVHPAEWTADLRRSFGVFRLRWKGPCNSANPLANRLIQPLPHRSNTGHISYPQYVEGWFWAPEASVAMMLANARPDVECEILDGWVWTPADSEEWPWEALITDMYRRRKVLQTNKNPTQMGFKLGMNSLYGKYAQRVGGKDKPPASHTLPIAGYVTSDCRASVMLFMLACKPDSVISVETDGVFTTTAPDELVKPERFPLSDKLGEWGLKVYDRMIVIQNGVYLLQKDGVWLPPKSRGIPASAVKPDLLLTHLADCVPGERWPALEFAKGEGFLGLGAAIARSTRKNVRGKWSTNPFKASDLHCTWNAENSRIDVEGKTGKRAHMSQWCRACARGLSPAAGPHDMVIHTESMNAAASISALYELPWEKGYEVKEWEIEIEAEAILADSQLQTI